ncbi:MAG: Na/Pi symporter, partial [Peptostreptococcaceae bacterium]
MIIIKLMGGLGLFIYGMKLMGDGLENAAGDGLKSILEKVTSNPIKSVLVGIVVTAVIQSTAQLVSFKLDQIAPIFVFVGALLVMFARGKTRKEVGNIILGFGILFTGMGIMSAAMKPLTVLPVFEQLIVTVGDNWLIGVIAGAAITAVLQSSSATTG